MSYKAMDMDVLKTAIAPDIIDVYQNMTIMSYIKHVPIPDGIANDTWAQQYMTQSARAAWTAAGYKPNKVRMAFEGYKLPIDTYAQEMIYTEKDMAFYQKHGYFTKASTMLGENLAYTETHAFVVGLDGDGGTPHSGYYNYVLDEGTGSGSAVRPLIAYSAASAGVWTTFLNLNLDIANAIGGMEALGYNAATIWALIPKVAAPILRLAVSTDLGTMTMRTWIENQCAGIILLDNEHLPVTARATLPTTANLDGWFVDLAEVVFGVAREERIRTIGPHDDVRDTKVEAEKWGTPKFIPRPIATTLNGTTTTKFYKGVATLDGCKIT